MEFPSWLLTGPGALLVAAWLAEPTALEDDSETRAALAVASGAVFWVCVDVALRLSWRVVQRTRSAAALNPPEARHSLTNASDWRHTVVLGWGAA